MKGETEREIGGKLLIANQLLTFQSSGGIRLQIRSQAEHVWLVISFYLEAEITGILILFVISTYIFMESVFTNEEAALFFGAENEEQLMTVMM